MIDIEDYIDNLSQELDSEMQEYIIDWSYNYDYRFAMGLFIRSYSEQYIFDISFENNISAIDESIVIVEKKLNDEKELFEEIGWDAYLESKDNDFLHALKWSFRTNVDQCDLYHWDNYYDGSYSKYIEETIEQLPEVKNACLDFLDNKQRDVIERVFK